MNEQRLTNFLRRAAIVAGITLLFTSTYLSWDGFDGYVGGGSGYVGIMGNVIGWVFALTANLLQFILATDVRKLNKTLIFAGIASYAYSIYTNKLGAQNLLGMEGASAWVTAIIADLVAEPLLAWGIGDAGGGVVDNLLRISGGAVESAFQPHSKRTPPPTSRQALYQRQAQRDEGAHNINSAFMSALPKRRE